MFTTNNAPQSGGFPLTVLQTAEGLNASKTVVAEADGTISKIPFSAGSFFRFHPQTPRDLDEAVDLFTRLATARDCFVVRGAPINGLDLTARHRRRYISPKGGNALRAEPRPWVNLDIDGVAVPAGFDVASAVREAALYARDNLLPQAFRGVRCLLTPTSSTGLAGLGLSRFRLWAQIDRPIADDDLRRWALGCRADTNLPLDHAVFNPAQPSYTARPRFIGMGDPVAVADYAVILPGQGDVVALDVNQYDERYTAIRENVATAARAAHGNWRRLALAMVGGPEGFFTPLTRVIGMAVRSGASEPDIHNFLDRLLIDRADPARVREYGPAWRTAAINSFRRRDVAVDTAERRAALADLTLITDPEL